MCGFFGSLNTGITEEKFRSSFELIKHRGPDESRVEKIKNKEEIIYLGVHRLALNDKTKGSQPMRSLDDRYSILFNGEIYNHLELKKTLKAKGYAFKTSCDTEVALNSLIEWGESAVEKWIGMWAFAFVDHKKSTVCLLRDHFGQKPLYYSFFQGGILFASESSPIQRAREDHLSKDYLALSQFLLFDYIPAPRTAHNEIKELENGSYLKYEYVKKVSGGTKKYFNLPPLTEKHSNIEKTVGELTKSLTLTRESNYESAIALSGGVDSAILAYLGKKSGHNLNSYSLFFDKESFDESNKIKEIQNSLKNTNFNKSFLLSDIEPLFHKIYTKLDEPIGDSSMLPSYMLANEIAKRHKNFLTGDGGDELFFGYDTFKALLPQSFFCQSSFLYHTTKFISKRIKESHKNMSLKFKLERFLRAYQFPVEMWLPMWMSNTEGSLVNTFFGKNFKEEELFAPFLEVTSPGSKPLASRVMQRQFLNVYLPNNILMMRDRSSMLNSVEARAPLLNTNFARFCFQEKTSSHWSLFTDHKSLLKKIYKQIGLGHIKFPPKKGFGSPVGLFLSQLSEVQVDRTGLSKNKIFLNLLGEHKSGRSNNKSVIWNLFVLSKMRLI